jgi:hypothetical protein
MAPVPRWTPPELPVAKLVVAVVITVAAGTPPAVVAFPLQRLAPMPAANPFVQFAMSAKFSVYDRFVAMGTGVAARPASGIAAISPEAATAIANARHALSMLVWITVRPPWNDPAGCVQ